MPYIHQFKLIFLMKYSLITFVKIKFNKYILQISKFKSYSINFSPCGVPPTLLYNKMVLSIVGRNAFLDCTGC